MAMHLTLGVGLDALVDPLAEVLATVPDDPFAASVVAVPGEGVRSWLTWQLSQRLGGGHGIVANIEWVFPSTIVTRSLGVSDSLDPWSVDTLTWAVHHVLTTGAVDQVPHVQPDVSRARAIADVFDRYGTRRPGMVAAWERGHDVDALGRALTDAQCWQPHLWRALNAHLGSPSTAVLNFDRLTRLWHHGPPDEMPERLVLVGITSLPPFSLEVLRALSRHREVVMLSPIPSPDLWQRLGEVVGRLHHGEEHLDWSRSDDPSVATTRHPLMVSWGRSSREAQVHLAGLSLRHGVTPTVVAPPTGLHTSHHSLLAALHADLVADCAPVPRHHDLANDRSVRWHRCHGAARQAEVLRDVLLHLFEERDESGVPRFHPRDIAVLCTDVARFAPLIQAAFAGASDEGVPAIPVRVADRTLGGEAPLVDVVVSLVGLLDRRWRRDDIMAFARLGAVRQRFGFTPEHLGLVADWLDATHVRWGMRPGDHHRAGLPAELTAHSMHSGLEQLVVGAALASDVAMGPAGVAATGDLEGDDLQVLGEFADLIDRLADAVDDLARPAPVDHWLQRLQTAVADLADLPDADAWQWGVLADELRSLGDAAQLAGSHLDIDASQLGELVVTRLTSRSGRARFDTGAVTVSSVAGQRGIPRRVICLVGLDEAQLTTGLAASDDLVATHPMVGDPDPRADLRALLLDAVLAAEEQLLLLSTGFDVRTNDEVAPAVALAELVDTIDQLAGGIEAREQWVVDHPRQSWSLRSFLPDALGEPGPFSFHRGALAMFERSRGIRHRRTLLQGVLPPEPGDLELTHIASSLDNAVEALLRDRCGLWLPDTSERTSQVMPLTVKGLSAWALRDDALRAVLHAPVGRDPSTVIAQRLDLARRRGALPPLALGDPAAHDLQVEVEALIAEAQRLGAVVGSASTAVDVALDLPAIHPRRIRGRVEYQGTQHIVHLTTKVFQPAHLLRAWIDLAAITLAHPGNSWEAVVVSRATKDSARGQVLRLVSTEAAHQALTVAAQFTRRARQSVLPLTASVSDALYRRGARAARTIWASERGPSNNRWMQWAVGDTEFDELLTLEPWPDEQGPEWGGSPGRLQRWSHRLWATFDATVAGT
jgi:exodeoxyribonuclease V gamma subunit